MTAFSCGCAEAAIMGHRYLPGVVFEEWNVLGDPCRMFGPYYLKNVDHVVLLNHQHFSDS